MKSNQPSILWAGRTGHYRVVRFATEGIVVQESVRKVGWRPVEAPHSQVIILKAALDDLTRQPVDVPKRDLEDRGTHTLEDAGKAEAWRVMETGEGRDE